MPALPLVFSPPQDPVLLGSSLCAAQQRGASPQVCFEASPGETPGLWLLPLHPAHPAPSPELQGRGHWQSFPVQLRVCLPSTLAAPTPGQPRRFQVKNKKKTEKCLPILLQHISSKRKPQLCHLPTGQAGANYATFLCLSFPIC